MCSSRTDLAFIYPTLMHTARQRESVDPTRLQTRTEPGGKLWDQIKDVLCNRARESLETLRSNITLWLEGFCSYERRAFHLIDRGWLLAGANTSSATVVSVQRDS